MTVWHGLGFQMIIFLAGLQGIPNELYEAASVDGARRWHKFRYVTLPMLRPTLLFATVVASIGLMQFFEEPYVMTQGGPLDSTLSVSRPTRTTSSRSVTTGRPPPSATSCSWRSPGSPWRSSAS